jgi:hypothetical protein
MTTRKTVLAVARLLLVTALVGAALDLSLPLPAPPVHRCYVLDLSGSLFWGRFVRPDDVLRMLTQDASRGPAGDRFSMVGFAGTSVLLLPSSSRTEFIGFLERDLRGRLERLAADGTDRLDSVRTRIEDALDLALAQRRDGIPLQMILLTDGVETSGDALRAASRLRSASVPLEIVPLGVRHPPEIRLVAVRAPERTAPGSSFDVDVDIASTVRAPAVLSLLRGGRAVASREITVRSDSLTRHVFAGIPQETEASILEIRIAPVRPQDDLCPENNRIRFEVGREDPDEFRVLYLGPPPPRAIETRLAANPRYRLARDPGAGETPFDLVVLDNWPWDRVPPGVRASLTVWVRDLGAGLLVSGGARSLSSGGYAGADAIEPLLPVWASPDERLGLALVIDRSSSMGMRADGRRLKIDVARESLGRVLPLLTKEDRLTLLAFNESVSVLRPLLPPPSGTAFQGALRGIEPRLGTLLVPPLRKASEILAGSGAPPSEKTLSAGVGLRHILLVTDGETTESPGALAEIGRSLNRDSVTLTVIVTGERPSGDALKALLDAVRGARRIDLKDWSSLESLVEEDVRRRKGLIQRGPIEVIRGAPSPVSDGLPAPPPLAAANRTTLRKDALPVWSGPRGLPLLALRRTGAGRTAVLATDLDDTAWGAAWADWRPHGIVLLDRLAAHLLEGARDDAWIDVEPDARGERLDIVVNLQSGVETEAPHALDLRIRLPDGSTVSGQLPQTASRRYAGTVSIEAPGPYAVRVEIPSGDSSGSSVPVGSVLHTVPYAAEWMRIGRDGDALSSIAGAAGGTVVMSPSRLIAARPAGLSLRPARMVWLLAALLLLAADLLVSTFWLERKPPSRAPRER